MFPMTCSKFEDDRKSGLDFRAKIARKFENPHRLSVFDRVHLSRMRKVSLPLVFRIPCTPFRNACMSCQLCTCSRVEPSMNHTTFSVNGEPILQAAFSMMYIFHNQKIRKHFPWLLLFLVLDSVILSFSKV